MAKKYVTYEGKRYAVVTLLRCRAASAAQLSQCYAEEASNYERAAQQLSDTDWGLCDPAGWGDNGKGLPDNYIDLAEIPLPDGVFGGGGS